MAPHANSMENHKKNVPREGSTVKVIGPETCTSLLEMRIPARKTLSKIKYKLMTECKILFSLVWVMKVKILTANFSTMANCSLQNYYSPQLIPKPSAERKTTLLENAAVHKIIREKPTASRWHQVPKMWMNFQIMSFRTGKQTWRETFFSGKHKIIHCGSRKREH